MRCVFVAIFDSFWQTKPDDPEQRKLQVALQKVSEAVAEVNEIQRKEEERAAQKASQIVQIETSIEGAEGLGLSQDANRFIGTILFSHSPHYGISQPIVRMGEITRYIDKKPPVGCTMILFNNIVVVMRPQADK